MEISKELPLTLEQAAALPTAAWGEWTQWHNRLRHIQIIDGTRLVLVGEEASVEAISQEVKGVLARIKRQVYTLEAYGALDTPEGVELVANLQSELNVYINVEESQSPAYSRLPKLTEIFKPSADKQIKVKQGKLDGIKVDAIVCPTSPDFKLDSSEVGKYIKIAGGPSLEKECKTHYASIKRFLNYNEVVRTGVGNLKNCKHILHVVGPNVSFEEDQSNLQEMKTLIQNCLAECEKLSATSLAIPLEFNCTLPELSEALWSELSTTTRPIKELIIVDMDSNKLYQIKMNLKNKTSASQQAATAQAAAATERYVYDTEAKKLYTGEIEVSVYNGDITSVPNMQVIVNSTNKSMNLNAPAGTLTHTILQKAGNNIQDELSQKMARLKITETQGVMCSMGHNLGEILIYHASLVPYDGSPTGASVKRLRQVVKEAMEKTKVESRQSIAIPSIGSGVLQIPMEIVAKVLFEEVNNFSHSNPECSVQKVVLVAYDKNKPAVDTFSKKYMEVVARARKVEGWKQNLMPHKFQLQVTILSLEQKSITTAAQKLQDFLTDKVTEIKLDHNSQEPALQRINYEKKKALEGLQFTHRVSLDLLTSSVPSEPATINKMAFTGYKTDAKKAQRDALEILRA